MSSQSLRVVQITDCHLLADTDAALHGWRNWDALNAVLAHIRTAYPRIDAVVLTGDLVHDETDAGYRRLTERIRSLGAPLVCALPGNHDDPDRIAAAMPGVTTTGPVALGAWRIHLLNSHIHGSDSGRLGARALARLADDLAAHPDQPALVAVHHPPVSVGAAWLDAMRLADGDRLLELLAHHQPGHVIACGHVHQRFEKTQADTRILCTPAVTRQFLPGSASFAEDRARPPGYRVLRLRADGSFTTRVRRVPTATPAACEQKCG